MAPNVINSNNATNELEAPSPVVSLKGDIVNGAPPPPSNTGKDIFVGGISGQTTEDMLRSYFSQFGKVCDASVAYDQRTNRSRGFGFVTFEKTVTVEQVLLVHTMNRHVIHGKEVVTHVALTKKDSYSNNVECKRYTCKQDMETQQQVSQLDPTAPPYVPMALRDTKIISCDSTNGLTGEQVAGAVNGLSAPAQQGVAGQPYYRALPPPPPPPSQQHQCPLQYQPGMVFPPVMPPPPLNGHVISVMDSFGATCAGQMLQLPANNNTPPPPPYSEFVDTRLAIGNWQPSLTTPAECVPTMQRVFNVPTIGPWQPVNPAATAAECVPCTFTTSEHQHIPLLPNMIIGQF